MNIKKILPPVVSKRLTELGLGTLEKCVEAGELELSRVKGLGPGTFELIEVAAITKLGISTWTTDPKEIALLKFFLEKYGPSSSSLKVQISIWEARKFVRILELEKKLVY